MQPGTRQPFTAPLRPTAYDVAGVLAPPSTFFVPLIAPFTCRRRLAAPPDGMTLRTVARPGFSPPGFPLVSMVPLMPRNASGNPICIVTHAPSLHLSISLPIVCAYPPPWVSARKVKMRKPTARYRDEIRDGIERDVCVHTHYVCVAVARAGVVLYGVKGVPHMGSQGAARRRRRRRT